MENAQGGGRDETRVGESGGEHEWLVGLDGRGGLVDPDAAVAVWTHRQREVSDPSALRHDLLLDEHEAAAFTADTPRPRATVLDDGSLLVVLRGMDLNSGADPGDTVGVRMLLERDRLVTLVTRPVVAVHDVHAALAAGRGPHELGGVVAKVAERLAKRVGIAVAALDDEIEELGEACLAGDDDPTKRAAVARVRLRLAQLRRHFGPQREALAVLEDTLDGSGGARVREAGMAFSRDLDGMRAIHERAQILVDEWAHRDAARLGRNTYVLSLVAALFLPLGFVTGLLGINVGGMPGTESTTAFWVVCAGLLVLGVATVLLLRRLRLF